MDASNSVALKLQNSVTAKLVIVGFLVVACVVPTIFVFILLEERTDRRNEAVAEITDKWGANQVIVGPILSLPYSKSGLDSQGNRYQTTGVLNVLPEKLDHGITLEPEIRSRGIFDAVVYKAAITGRGAFALPDFDHAVVKSGDVEWDKAYVAMGITDTRGIVQQVNLKWNGDDVAFEPGPRNPVVGMNGMHAFAPVAVSEKTFEFSYSFDIQGGETIELLPLGKETNVSVLSEWNSPSFIGAYLPAERDVSDKGFSALWTVSSFGRSYPGQWLDSEVSAQTLEDSRFGVSLIQSVDFYTQVNRTIKYAVMFIAITFMAFFLFEVLSRLRVHPFQYLLVGLALALFYLLLLSFSERIGFLPAYAFSAIATVGLITSYSAKVLQANKKALTVAGLLLVLYTYLYIIVQLEDLALLFGSLLLFALLASTMYLTRNIDWYRVDAGERK